MVAGIGAVCLLFAGFTLSHPRPADEVKAGQTIPVCAFAAAALVALLPAATILPKSSDDAVWLAAAARARAEIDAQFLRVFDGQGTSSDVHDLATQRL